MQKSGKIGWMDSGCLCLFSFIDAQMSLRILLPSGTKSYFYQRNWRERQIHSFFAQRLRLSQIFIGGQYHRVWQTRVRGKGKMLAGVHLSRARAALVTAQNMLKTGGSPHLLKLNLLPFKASTLRKCNLLHILQF